MNIIFVFIGGGLGALSRYICVQHIGNKFIPNFPLGTLFVNSLGSLIIGFLYKTFETYIIPVELPLFIITGFLGGYTTFSTYSFPDLAESVKGLMKSMGCDVSFTLVKINENSAYFVVNNFDASIGIYSTTIFDLY